MILKVDLSYANNVEARMRFLQSMYNKHAKGFPGLVQIEKGPLFIKDQRIYKVVMILCTLNLKNENDLREMVKCVLTELVRLHEGRFVHRDIQIPNILYVPESPDNYNYVLIDFEHGGRNRQKPGKRLNGCDENKLTDGEMYQLGKMLEKYDDWMTADGNDVVNKLKLKSSFDSGGGI
jgi:serine/threonine protein kinase